MQVPILDDLLAAFEEVREQARTGRAYRSRDAEEIVQLVTSRGEGLGGHLRQLTRLVRLAALCSRHVYLEFFEMTVRSARPGTLGDVIARGLAEHHVPSTKIALQGDRVIFHEPEMRLADDATGAFEIAFSQVARLAALHHVLCRFLHYPRLLNSQAIRDPRARDDERGLLWTLCEAVPACGADEVARRLQSALNSHLTRVFEATGHTARQVQAISGFLKSRLPEAGLATAPSDLVDNRLLLEFWETTALSGEEGFKLYRSAVTKMLRYRRALAHAQAEFSTHIPIGSSASDNEIDLDRLQLAHPDDASTGSGAVLLEGGSWHSPMVALAPLFETVKVLNDTERRQLSNFLNGCADGAPDDGEDATDDEPPSDSGAVPDFRLALNREFARPFGSALFGADRFDLRLARTLLRVDVFDPCQRSIGLRAERGDAHAIDVALADIGEASYHDREQAYLAVREQLLKGMHASLYILGSLGDVSALVLMARLCDRSVVTQFARLAAAAASDDDDDEDTLSDMTRDDIGARLRLAFTDEDVIEDEGVREVVRRARKAAEQVRRKGFRREQWSSDAGIRDVLAAATGELIRLLDEIDRLLGALRRLDRSSAATPGTGLVAAAAEDGLVFTSIFHRLYPAGTGDRPG